MIHWNHNIKETMGHLHYIKAEIVESYPRMNGLGFGMGEITHHYLCNNQSEIAIDITSIAKPDTKYPVAILNERFTKTMKDLTSGKIKISEKGLGSIVQEGSCTSFEEKPFEGIEYNEVISAMNQIATAEKAWFRKARKKEIAINTLRLACINSGLLGKI